MSHFGKQNKPSGRWRKRGVLKFNKNEIWLKIENRFGKNVEPKEFLFWTLKNFTPKSYIELCISLANTLSVYRIFSYNILFSVAIIYNLLFWQYCRFLVTELSYFTFCIHLQTIPQRYHLLQYSLPRLWIWIERYHNDY